MGLKHSLVFILPTLGIVYFARALAVYGTMPLVNRIKGVRPIGLSYQTILVWGGLRGGLALALVLLLPEGFPHKQVFLALASAVVLSTLFVNALTIDGVLEFFGLKKLNFGDRKVYLKTLNGIIQAALAPFYRAGERGQYSTDVINHQRAALVHLYDGRLSDFGGDGGNEFAHYDRISSALSYEQASYNHQLENGSLSKRAYTRLIQTVSERRVLLADEDWTGLENYRFQQLRSTKARRLAGNISTLSTKLEALLHLRLALETVPSQSKSAHADGIVGKWIELSDQALKNFYSIYPDYSLAVQTLDGFTDLVDLRVEP